MAKNALDLALAFLRRQGSFVRKELVVQRIKTGIVGFDFLTGGGVPRGLIIELFGTEGSGKTTLAGEITKAFQDYHLNVIYLDYEHSVDLSYFKRMKIDLNEDKFLFDQPFCLESGMDNAIKLIETGKIGLLIVDSVAAMLPKAELEGALTDDNIALQARKLGRTFRKLVGLLHRNNTAALFINQLRDRIGFDARFHPTMTPGGRALKFYASIRLELKRLAKTDDSGNTSHRLILIKNKSCPVFGGAVEFSINAYGLDRLGHLKQTMLNLGILHENSVGSFSFGEETERAKEVYAKSEERLNEKLKLLVERNFFEELIIKKLSEEFMI